VQIQLSIKHPKVTSSSNIVIIQALLRGQTDGMNILTLSLGGADAWTEGSSGVVASRLVDMGIVVTIATGEPCHPLCNICLTVPEGNDGDVGAFYDSSPGTGIDVIAVASVDA
jgi:hypothetical protein